MNHDESVYDLAQRWLKDAPKTWIDRLADDLQRTCEDAAEEYDAHCTEQASLAGLTDDQKARI